MNEDYSIIWKNFINLLMNRIAMVSVNSYFKNCKLHFIEDTVKNNRSIKVITIEIPSSFVLEALKNRYIDTIEETFENILGKKCEVNFILAGEIDKKEVKIEKINKEESRNNATQISMDMNLEITDNQNNNTLLNDNLNSKYTFENFIIGESNRLAYTASKSVAEQPGKLYNPFFIHGKSGLGKTHLMHAIGNYIKNVLNKKVLYVTSEQFITDFTSMNLKKNTDYIQAFKNKYRQIDVLMIDDIQFLSGAEKTQQEFFHTFNNLYDLNKQIIISSDRSPDDLKLLEERLRTRFSWGLTVNIYPPELELKKRIVKDKMSEHDIKNLVEDDVIEYIAANSENDVRHLEGAVTRLFAYAAIIVPQKIDIDFATEALRDYLKISVYMDSNITKIQKAVADYFKLTVEDLKSKKRVANINYARQIAIYLCRMYTEESFPKIGSEFGNRDHSTIMHACDKISNEIKENSKLKEIIKEIKNNIN